MKEPPRTVRTAVVIYDCSRLLFLVILLAAFTGSGPAGLFRSMGRNLPFMMYAAPQALFPLMSFFLLIRLEISKSYIPLYITGKAICILCLTFWLAAAFGPAGGIPRSMSWALFMGAADFGTILGMVLLLPFNRGGAAPAGAEDEETGAPVFAKTPEGSE
ncbi:MAG: hypothetical protein LBK77_08430 [Spirochaetaceae bacterium]|jgi:hypothetical protein|nr:hypothetical protein [Spirochaetaceae bacterium]